MRIGDTRDVVNGLRARLEEDRRRRARQAGWTRRFVPTGLSALDEVLPHGGIPAGAITEILGDGKGTGALSLAMRLALRCARGVEAVGGSGMETADYSGVRLRRTGATRSGDGTVVGADGNMPTARSTGPWACHPERSSGKEEAEHSGTEAERHSGIRLRRTGVTGERSVVVVDTAGDLYPPAVWQRGLSPHQLVVIRAGDAKTAFWSVEQSLRCPAVAVVVASMGSLDVRQSRRLQLAAESCGCVGLVLQGDRRRGRSFAAVRMLVEGVSSGDASGGAERRSGVERMILGDARLCRITLLKVREGAPAGPLLMDLDHETGACAIPTLPVDRPAARLA